MAIREKFYQAAVMDVLPWPHGHGFGGRESWWEYVLSKDERQKLDHVLGIALLDASFQKRLIEQCDDTLLQPFGLSEETCKWLRTLKATSLAELGQAIASRTQDAPSLNDAEAA